MYDLKTFEGEEETVGDFSVSVTRKRTLRKARVDRYGGY